MQPKVPKNRSDDTMVVSCSESMNGPHLRIEVEKEASLSVQVAKKEMKSVQPNMAPHGEILLLFLYRMINWFFNLKGT